MPLSLLWQLWKVYWSTFPSSYHGLLTTLPKDNPLFNAGKGAVFNVSGKVSDRVFVPDGASSDIIPHRTSLSVR